MLAPGFSETELGLLASAQGGHALFTGRAGGVSASPYDALNLGPWTADAPASLSANRGVLEDWVSRDRPREVILGRQVHETSVAAHLTDAAPVPADGVDAHITDRLDLAVAVLTADCVPIALLAPWGVGAVHAGWRGLAGGIVGGAIGELVALGGPEAEAVDIAAFIGPCAGACCYEVGDEVQAAFAGWPGHDSRQRNLDLVALVSAALGHEGVGSVAAAGRCTICDDRYFSHRASGGTTGRQVGVAWRA